MDQAQTLKGLSSQSVPGWSYEDQAKVVDHLLQFGIEVDAEDQPDYLAIAQACALTEYSVADVREFIQQLLAEGLQFGGASQLPGVVASCLIKRVATIGTLRRLCKRPQEEFLMATAEIRQRGVPRAWHPETELNFFRKLLRCGFGSAELILGTPEFALFFEGSRHSFSPSRRRESGESANWTRESSARHRGGPNRARHNHGRQTRRSRRTAQRPDGKIFGTAEMSNTPSKSAITASYPICGLWSSTSLDSTPRGIFIPPGINRAGCISRCCVHRSELYG